MVNKIGLVCIGNSNYGNNLTNYCLYRVLDNMGYDVTVINVSGDLYEAIDGCDLFAMFRGEVCKKVINPQRYAELDYIGEQFDLFITGSDQIWRWGGAYLTDWYTYLAWLNPQKPRISYSSSFGIESFEGGSDFAKVAGGFLARFKAISVRESSGINIIKDEFGVTCKNVAHVLDPVLMCSAKCIREVFMPEKKDENDTFVYLWDNNEFNRKLINRIEEQFGYESEKTILVSVVSGINLNKRNDTCTGIPSEEEWLKAVNGCKLLITDSYHGICTALALEKQFVFLLRENERGNERIIDLLKMLKLEERMVSCESDINNISRIDYKQVKDKLDILRRRCVYWLTNAIESPWSYSKNESEYFDRWLKDRKYNTDKIKKYREYVNKQIEKRIIEPVEIVVWGMNGVFYEESAIMQRELGIRYVIDNDSAKHGRRVGCVSCIGPDEIEMSNYAVLILLRAKSSIEEVKKQLKNAGAICVMSYYDIEKL